MEKYQKENPDDSLSSESAADARYDINAKIAVAYQDFNHYDVGVLVKNYEPGENFYNVTEQLESAAIDITTNFLDYAYLRHKTNVAQIEHVVETDFTQNNLLAIQGMVNAAAQAYLESNETSSGTGSSGNHS